MSDGYNYGDVPVLPSDTPWHLLVSRFEEPEVEHGGHDHGGTQGNLAAGSGHVPHPKLANAETTIDRGILLFQEFEESTHSFTYKIENRNLNSLEFTFDASLSKNMACSDWHNNIISLTVPPMTKMLLGTIGMVDPTQGGKLKAHFIYKLKELQEEQVEAADHHRESRDELRAALSKLGIAPSQCPGGAAEIKEKLKEANIHHFVDLEFFPNDSALFDNGRPRGTPIVWKRPKDIFNGDIHVFDEGINPCDVHQGALGDCWLLSALSSMADFPEEIKKLFITPHYDEMGIYEVRLFKDGRETRVVIDDYFPCAVNGVPAYSRNTSGNELWVMIVEKAMAKLHGNYQRIEDSFPFRALIDLTGAPGTSIRMREHPRLLETGEFWRMLLEWESMGYIMCATTRGKDNLTKNRQNTPDGGLVPGHAYTLKTVQEKNGVRLVNLRNPWGKFEWDGDWSDKDVKHWTPEMRQAFGPKLNQNDGLFWVCAKDFYDHFSSVHVAYHRGHSGLSTPWDLHRLEFVTTERAICDDVYELTLPSPAFGFFTLEQRDTLQKGTPSYIPLSFSACELGDLSTKAIETPAMSRRENLHVIPKESPLGAGKYVVGVQNPRGVPGRKLVLVIALDGGTPGLVCSRQVSLTEELRDIICA